jgi:hypothetical protein
MVIGIAACAKGKSAFSMHIFNNKEFKMKLMHIQLMAVALQWGLILWLNLRIDADPFIQLVVTPLLLLLSLALLPARHSATSAEH